MARKPDFRGGRTGPPAIAGQEDGEPVWILGYAGNPLTGTASPDFLLAQDAATINGGGGDDFILGDIGPFGTAQTGNGSFAAAYDFAFITHCFSTVENPLFADDSIPHATVYVLGENQQEYFQIVVGAGQTLTIDIDGAGGTVGGATHTDTIVELYAAGDLVNPVASNDDANFGLGGYGSEAYPGSPGVSGNVDSFLTVTNGGAAATYYIRIREFGLDGNFETDDDFLLNLSLTGYATGGSTLEHGDTINGEAGNDHLYGGAGNDILNGGSGFDVMVGGTGDDLFIVDDPSDFVVEAPNEGNDRISARSSFQMSPDASIETLTYFDNLDQIALLLAGSSIANTITAANGSDVLRGLGGNDILNGLGGADQLDGGAGADTMDGGAQSDTYFVDDAGDLVVEADNLNGGSDTIFSSTSYTLAAGASVETLSAQSQAGTAALALTGNGFNQIIYGNAGDNLLNGLGGADFLVGGAGNDILIGGTGDDTYYVDDSGDAITEFSGEGDDRIAASVSYALAADANVERIEAVNLAAVNAMDLTGSAIANVIYGNDGINILRGEDGNDELRGFGGSDFLVGGTGADLMVGGLGDDTFYVDDATDAVGEIAGQGSDRIAASVSFVLSNGADVEILEAVNVASATPFDLTGSDSNNTITGNAGSNILRGEGGADILSGAGGNDFLVGGAGNDTMGGGTGNDTFYVDAIGDVVNEFAGEGGLDRVVASASFALSVNANVELLETATQSSTTAINLVGSSIANTINGNDGANVLDGRDGSDILTGFGGADTFQFGTALGAGNIDTLVGFVSGSDKIALDDAVFTGIGPAGALAAGAFVVNNAAQDADDRILYNSQTGQLYFDADGNGGGAAVQFATLSGNPALAASDFQVI